MPNDYLFSVASVYQTTHVYFTPMKLELTKWQADLLFIIVNEAVVRALKRDLPEQNQLYRELLFVIANQFAKQEARYPKKDKDV